MRLPRSVAALIAVAAVSVCLTPVRGLSQDEPDAEEAEESDESETESAEVKRGRTIRFDRYGATLERPVGWVRAESGEGAILTLQAAGDRQSQFEVRVSSPVPRDRRESFFSSFHAQLEQAGFSQGEVRERASYGANTGRWTAYSGESKQRTFRLVVWQLYRRETAWLFVGFFPEQGADRYVDDFESLLASLTFQ